MSTTNQTTANQQKKLILSSEQQAEFDKLRSGLFAKHAPANDDECRLVEMHAVNAWRMVRLRAQEVAFFDRAAQQLMNENPELTYDEAISDLFLEPQHPEKIRLFLRYQTAIERAYAKSLAELEAALASRRAESVESLYQDEEDEEKKGDDRETALLRKKPLGSVAQASACSAGASSSTPVAAAAAA